MGAKEKKPSSKGSKKEVHKETEKSIKSLKSLKSTKSLKSSKSNKSLKSSKSKNSEKSEKKSHHSKSPIVNELSPPKDEENQLNSNLFPKAQTYNIHPSYPGHGIGQGILQSNPLSKTVAGNYVEKCDGCFEADAVCYCKECEKSYCSLCENQIHVVPAYRNHQRIPLTEMTHLKKLCYHHNNPLKFYCESCDEPICHECQIIGPHNTKLHRISNLMDAFKSKYQAMKNIVDTELLKRYEILTGNLEIIDKKISEVDDVASNIERQINISYNTMLEHLKNEKGKRIAVLNYESANIQKDLVNLDEIISSVKNANQDNDMIGFLLRYNQLNEQIEQLATKPTALILDKDLTKLPSDFESMQNKLNNYQKLEKLVKIKDDIIWELLKNIKGTSASQINERVQNDRYGGGYGKTPSLIVSNKDLMKKIKEKVQRSNINFYQLLCEFDNGEGREMINQKDIPRALNKINIDATDQDVSTMLVSLGIKETGRISIKNLSREIASFRE